MRSLCNYKYNRLSMRSHQFYLINTYRTYLAGRCSTKCHKVIASITDQVLKKPSKNANVPYAIQKKQAISICTAIIIENGRCKPINVPTFLTFPKLFMWRRKLKTSRAMRNSVCTLYIFYLISTP